MALATAGTSGVSLVAMNVGTPVMEERELVAAVLARRAGAFERLVRDYERLCWHVIQRMVRHPEDTRELCQEALLRVHQCLHQYRHESPLKSWIAQVAYSVAKRHLERRRIPLAEPALGEDGLAMAFDVADEADVERDRGKAEVGEHLQRSIEALPPLQRTVLMLYHLEEVPIGEIARITGLAEGTIKSHLFRSRQRLRETLERGGVTSA